MTPPKKTNKTPITDPKEMESYDLCDNKLKNSHLKETQYNTRGHRYTTK